MKYLYPKQISYRIVRYCKKAYEMNYKELAETAHRFKNEGEQTMQGTQLLRDFVDKHKDEWYDEGAHEKQRQIVISMIKNGISEELICKVTGLDIAEVVAIKNEAHYI